MSMSKYLTPEGKAEYNSYMRQYRKDHKEAVKQYRNTHKEVIEKNQADYWNRKAAARETAEANSNHRVR